MAWYPGAIKRPVELFSRPVQNRNGVKPNVLVLHVAVSTGTTLYNYFNRPGSQSCSHFYVRFDGTVEQYIDTDLRSAAEQQGSQRAISIETAGGTNPATVETEPWTAAQLESLAKLTAWANEVHGIPLVKTPDSRSTTGGISWHRRGIKGNWSGAQKAVSWVAGEIWSGNGKSCPGFTKIMQIDGIIARAKQLVTGGSGGGISPLGRNKKMFLVWNNKGTGFLIGTRRVGIPNIQHYNLLKRVIVSNQLAERPETFTDAELMIIDGYLNRAFPETQGGDVNLGIDYGRIGNEVKTVLSNTRLQA